MISGKLGDINYRETDMTKPFATKQAAEAAAAGRPLAGAVWVGPVVAIVLKLSVGWYVGFPSNVDQKLYGQA
jgi:hypothetical protein